MTTQPNQTIHLSAVPQRYKNFTIILALLLSVTAHASTQNQQATSLTNETMSCTLYQVAIQGENLQHSTSLHCEDNLGLSYELVGHIAEIKKQY